MNAGAGGAGRGPLDTQGFKEFLAEEHRGHLIHTPIEPENLKSFLKKQKEMVRRVCATEGREEWRKVMMPVVREIKDQIRYLELTAIEGGQLATAHLEKKMDTLKRNVESLVNMAREFGVTIPDNYYIAAHADVNEGDFANYTFPDLKQLTEGIGREAEKLADEKDEVDDIISGVRAGIEDLIEGNGLGNRSANHGSTGQTNGKK